MTNSIKKIAAVFLSACMAVNGMAFTTSAYEGEVQADSVISMQSEETIDFSYLNAVGMFTTAETQKFAQLIYDGIRNHEKSINIVSDELPPIYLNDLSFESLRSIYQSVVSGYDVGILTKKNSWAYNHNVETLQVLAIMPTYLVDSSEYDAEYNAMMQVLDEATAGVDENWSEAEKALYLYNWMIEEFYYTSQPQKEEDKNELFYTAYGVINNGHGVCEGFSWLYTLLMKHVGVNCQMIISKEANHSWNAVEIDGEWYYVDVTRGDDYSKHPGIVNYSRFLKSRRELKKTGITSDDWQLVTGASVYNLIGGDRYDNAFWNNARTTIAPAGGHTWIAVIPDEVDIYTSWIMKYEFDPETGEAVSEPLTSWSSSGSELYDVYVVPAVPVVWNDVVFYCTHKEFFFLYQKQPFWLANLLDYEIEEFGYIYGMKLRGDKLYYYLSKNVYAPPTEFVLDLTIYEDTIQSAIDQMNAQTTPTEETTTTTEETTTT
ncbi:MAG: hypothetical protein IKC40_08235, partial [Oscillospiraceae bacterium]|nr:hypothetical protein [Oscillospiraceae bacterium]